MIKNIIILLLIAVSIVCLSFGYRQKQLADEFRLLAIENEMKANEQRLIAEQQSRIALANQTEAMHQRQLAMENAEQANKMQMLAKTNEARAIANEQQAKQQQHLAEMQLQKLRAAEREKQ